MPILEIRSYRLLPGTREEYHRREGPREAVVAKIEVYTDVVIEVDAATIEGMRQALAR